MPLAMDWPSNWKITVTNLTGRQLFGANSWFIKAILYKTERTERWILKSCMSSSTSADVKPAGKSSASKGKVSVRSPWRRDASMIRFRREPTSFSSWSRAVSMRVRGSRVWKCLEIGFSNNRCFSAKVVLTVLKCERKLWTKEARIIWWVGEVNKP